MRQHFKRTICSHATPDGKAVMGEREKLRKKFDSGNITSEELWSYCMFMHSSRPNFTVKGEVSFDIPETKKTFKTIKVWGKEIQVSIEEHRIHCAHLNF